jgi:hypothetical protein
MLKYVILLMVTFSAMAEDKIIRQVNSLGQIRYDKPSYVVKSDGRVYQRDTIGNIRYDLPSFKLHSGAPRVTNPQR